MMKIFDVTKEDYYFLTKRLAGLVFHRKTNDKYQIKTGNTVALAALEHFFTKKNE